MDYEKQIRILTNENEFLQEQMEELQAILLQKNETKSDVPNETESAVSLLSRLDMKTYEIEQLKYNNNLDKKKYEESEMLRGELETDLLQKMKNDQLHQKKLKELETVNNQLVQMEDELNEAADLYKQVIKLTRDYVEAKSLMDLANIQIDVLQKENDELKQLNQQLRIKAFNNV